MANSIVSKPQAAIFTQRLQQLDEQIIHLENQLQKLGALKVVDASPYWLNGLYLYLIHPKRKGQKRVRDYVGNDPQRVAEALAMVERGRQAKQIRARITQLKNQHTRAQSLFSEAVSILADANSCEVNYG